MSNSFLGKGWKFPVTLDPATGKIMTSEYEEDIQESIRIILATSKGERIMQPDFGCGIHNFVFTAMDSTSLSRIKSSVKEALIRWEPRIQDIEVNTQSGRPSEGVLLIDVSYRVRSTNNQFNLVYPFYLNEG